MKDLNITIPDNRPGTLILSGKIDTLTSPQLRSALAGMEETAEVTGTVVLDMAEVNYISSSGLRELLIASKKLGSKAIFLDKVTPEVEEIFKVTGFSDIFR